MQKFLLRATAILEGSAGIGFLAVPAVVAKGLGGSVEGGTDVLLARLFGVAMAAFGALCWFAARDTGSTLRAAVLAAMAYHLAAGILVGQAASAGVLGPTAWGVAGLHGVFFVALAFAVATGK